MTINISLPDVEENLHPKITVLGVGGSGGNAVNNMINSSLEGVDFLIANTDAQALQHSKCSNKIQLGLKSTKGLGAGMRPDIGKQAAEEALEELTQKLDGSHMLFIAAGMGGGTGTGAAPIIAKLARERGILTVGVVTKPFHFEGSQRMKLANTGIDELQQYVDTLLIIPNQNLFRIANEKTTFADAFKMADDVLYAGVRGVTDLMVQPGMINLDFSDVKTIMSEMGKAMMGTGEASGEGRSIAAAEAAIANPLIDDVSLKGAKGLIINITGGKDITLYEVDEAANRIKQEVDEEANIIYGTTCDDRLEGLVRVSIVATGIDINSNTSPKPLEEFSSVVINNSIYQKNNSNQTQAKESIVSNAVGKEPVDEPAIIQDDESHTIDSMKVDLNEDISLSNEKNELNSETIIQEGMLNSIENSEIENKSENDLNNLPNETNKETTVRRLSLFDTISKDEAVSASSKSDDLRTEPVISSNSLDEEGADQPEQSEEFTDSSEPEIGVEEGESIQLDEEFNQETEELLDIPTFLRRQAN